VPEVRKRAAFPVKRIEADVGANPKRSGSILKNRPDFIAADSVWIARVVLISRKCFCDWIKTVKTTRIRTDPKDTRIVLIEGPDKIIAQAVRIVPIVLIDGNSISIKFVETILSSKPHETAPILDDALYVTIGQALFHSDTVEAN
jgi:hypothetical protein